jgi:hypothetical protein
MTVIDFEQLENELHADLFRSRAVLFADHIGPDGLIDWSSYQAAVDAMNSELSRTA